MDPPPHPLSNATHFLRYHPLRCIIIFIILAVCVADDMFEGFLLANWLQYFYHRMESERYPTTMCIRMGWLMVGYGGRGNRRLALRWGSWFFDVRIIYYYYFLRMHDVRWLPITLVCVVHNDVCCVLGLAMVYGELQRLRLDGLVDGCLMVQLMYPFDDSMMWILYSSTADWHRCTCFLLSWIVVVIRLFDVSNGWCICSIDGSKCCCWWRWCTWCCVLSSMACNFVDGTELLFGKEALPLALPIFVITVR